MKVYITKYALTKGIYVANVEQCVSSPGMVADRTNSWPMYYYGEGKDWHRSRSAAVKRAEEMATAKIRSLQKQIKKIEATRAAGWVES